MNVPLIVLFALSALADDPGTVADRIVLRDGSEVLGQVVASRADRVAFVVRRAWAEEHLPSLAARWEDRDRAASRAARDRRIDRLRRWRVGRKPPPAGADPLGEAIGRELDRLERRGEDDAPPLLLVTLGRREVSRLESQPEGRRRMLRQGWRAGFDVESMPTDRLRDGLQARGFAPAEVDPAPIDDLVPIPAEDNRRWLFRRAATEVLSDPDLRLIRFGDLAMTDPGPAGAVDQAAIAGLLGDAVGALLGERAALDPMAPLLGRIEDSGRVGAVVTALEIGPGFDRVAVEAVLLVRTGPARWEPAGRRRAEVRTADLPGEAGRPLAEDPQVKAALGLIGGLGIGRSDPEARRLGLAVGVATQRALAEARSALEGDLQEVALRLGGG